MKQLWSAAPEARAAIDSVRLNVGCGSTAPSAWTNIDNSPTIWLAQHPLAWRLARFLRMVPADMDDTPRWAPRVIVADARRSLPFSSGCVDAIYTSHFLEHLSREDGVLFLREARRLLRPRGLIRIVVPDMAALVDRYHQDRAAGDPRAADWFFENLWVVDKGLARYPAWLQPLKSFLRTDAHKWLYDEASLTALMAEIGFTEMRRRGYLESEMPGIEQVEDLDRFRASVCVEARNPGLGEAR